MGSPTGAFRELQKYSFLTGNKVKEEQIKHALVRLPVFRHAVAFLTRFLEAVLQFLFFFLQQLQLAFRHLLAR